MNALERHIVDTGKEWQLKIGYREGNMKLYYPASSLADLLETGTVEDAELQKRLETFGEEVQERLGKIKFSCQGGRYCLDIPPKGCAYVATKVPVPEFLKLLLEVITTPGKRMEDVRKCFAAFASQKQIGYTETDSRDHEMGHVFYFEPNDYDPYVYCVEENEFGLTYHRFTRAEYENLNEL